jgi:N-acetylmuramoyl-L-alanine amidase
LLDRPLGVEEAGLATAGAAAAELSLRLVTVEAARFAAAAGAPEAARLDLPDPVAGLAEPRRRQTGDRPVVVALDPGHGGIDPGAERGGHSEAALMLTFARELAEVLTRAGGFEVVLTRDADVFVPLEARQSIARAAGADLFISLHADALAEGRARGAKVYTLAETASDLATEKLAERHDRADLLAGVDLIGQGDAIAHVLMDMARADTAPRAERLADAIAAGLKDSTGNLHKRPRLSGAFSVLKAPDIPSVLVELGFMSDARDLANLTDPDWRARAALGIRDALVGWAAADAAEALLVRQ